MRQFDGTIGSKDAILMLVSQGLADFVENTVLSIKRAQVTGCDLIVAMPPAAREEVASGLARHPEVRCLLLEPDGEGWGSAYHDYGTTAFGAFTLAKWVAILKLFEAGYERVTFSDVDIAWRRDPMPLLRVVLLHYELAIQTEGQPSYPPHCCTGYMSWRNSEFNLRWLTELQAVHKQNLQKNPSIHDQTVFNRLLVQHPDLVRRLYPLSECTFAVGLFAPALALKDPDLLALASHRLDPMIFHANWAIGLAQKKVMLERTGNWLLER